MIALDRRGDVFVLRMDAGENRFGPQLLERLGEALDRVGETEGPTALVTVGSGKFFSNGLDLDHMGGVGAQGASDYLGRVLALLGRVLTFPAFTVAAVNGHAFGAGAQLAAAHDLRLMRADRGFFCMPEVDMGVPLHPGMIALLSARLPRTTTHHLLATAHRYGGEEAARAGIVEQALPEAELLPVAVERAAALAAKASPAMGRIKRDLHASVLEALAVPLTEIDLSV